MTKVLREALTPATVTLVLMMILILVAPGLAKSQDANGNLVLPDSWTQPAPVIVFDSGCCCDTVNKIYDQQMYEYINQRANRPSTLGSIGEIQSNSLLHSTLNSQSK